MLENLQSLAMATAEQRRVETRPKSFPPHPNSEATRLLFLGKNQEETVTRTREFQTKDFGYDTELEKITMQQVVAPVRVNGAEVIMRILQKPRFDGVESYDATGKKEVESTTDVTWIHIGGAASQDESHVGDLAVRAYEATKNSALKLDNLILLAHPIGAPRSKSTKEGVIFDESDFGDSATALLKALENPEIKISGKVILTGLSAGGAVATTLAAMRPDIDFLVLMDPAGMGQHDNLALNFALKDPIRGYKAMRQQGKSRIDALRKTWDGLSKSMATGAGSPRNIITLIKAFFPDETHKRLVQSYGLSDSVDPDGARINLLSKDSTIGPRNTLSETNPGLQLIVSPAMAGDVVNFLKQKNGWTDDELMNAAENPDSEDAKRIIDEANKTLNEMFPGIEPNQRHLLPWWGKTHASVATEQEYLNLVVEQIEQLLESTTNDS